MGTQTCLLGSEEDEGFSGEELPADWEGSEVDVVLVQAGLVELWQETGGERGAASMFIPARHG